MAQPTPWDPGLSQAMVLAVRDGAADAVESRLSQAMAAAGRVCSRKASRTT
jgi:hypothetical protein